MPVASQRSYTTRFNDQIQSLSTKDFDSVPFSSFSAVKYLISIFSQVESSYKISELFAVNDGSDITDQLIYKSSSGPKVSINVLKNGSDVVLRLVNQENFEVDVSIVKMLL